MAKRNLADCQKIIIASMMLAPVIVWVCPAVEFAPISLTRACLINRDLKGHGFAVP
jgi:hypothetical protein